MNHHVHARMEAGDIHLRHNLGRADPCDLPSIFAALGENLDLDGEALRKAVVPAGEPPDPRYPELITLAKQARKEWERFGTGLVEQVDKLLREGKLLPMTTENEAALRELFRDHEVGILARFSGHPEDLPRLRRLVDAGLVASTSEPSLIELSYRLGRGLHMLEPHTIPAVGEPPPLAKIIRDAMRVEMTPRDRQAMGYAQRRAAVFMRRPVAQSSNAVERELSLIELNAFQQATADAVKGRKTAGDLERALRDAAAEVSEHHPERALVRDFGPGAVGPATREAMAQGTLQNDMERVARTELAFAHCYGAYEALRAQTAALGIADPEVYKFCSDKACTECRRIWGPIRSPHVYRLSFIEAREAAGGNFGKKREDWGPVIGPIHSRCSGEGGLAFYNRKLVDAITASADAIMAVYNRGS